MKEKILYDVLEKKFKSKYNKGIAVSIIIMILFFSLALNGEYFIVFFIIQAILIFPFLPNYLFLKKVTCPNCQKNYFTPFMASKEDIKILLKSNPKCVNCNYESEIISEYKTMY